MNFSHSFELAGRRLHWARTVSFLGSAFTEFAIPLFLLKHSGNPLHVGLQWALLAVARLASGYWAPSWGRFKSDRQALAFFDLCQAAAALLPVLLFRWHPVLACYVTTLCMAFFSTAQAGYLESFVGHAVELEKTQRESARSWLLSRIENGRHFGMLMGYSLAYLVSSRLGFQVAFMIDAASFVASAWLISRVPSMAYEVGQEEARDRLPQAASVASKASYSLLWRPKARILTLSQCLAGFGLYLYNASYVVSLKNGLNARDGEMSLLYILQYVGYYLGSRFASGWVERTGRPLPDRYVVLMRFCFVPVFVAFALATNSIVFVAANSLLSFMIGSSLPGVAALFQRLVSREELRGMGAARIAVTSLCGAAGAALASIWLVNHSSQGLYFLGAGVYLFAALFLVIHCRRVSA